MVPMFSAGPRASSVDIPGSGATPLKAVLLKAVLLKAGPLKAGYPRASSPLKACCSEPLKALPLKAGDARPSGLLPPAGGVARLPEELRAPFGLGGGCLPRSLVRGVPARLPEPERSSACPEASAREGVASLERLLSLSSGTSEGPIPKPESSFEVRASGDLRVASRRARADMLTSSLAIAGVRKHEALHECLSRSSVTASFPEQPPV